MGGDRIKVLNGVAVAIPVAHAQDDMLRHEFPCVFIPGVEGEEIAGCQNVLQGQGQQQTAAVQNIAPQASR